MEVIAECIRKYGLNNVVYGPVLTTAGGQQLLSQELSVAIEAELLPLCTVVASRLKVVSLINGDQHGMKGIFLSAIATFLALGSERDEAIRKATEYVNRQVALEQQLEGRGSTLYNELLRLIALHHRERNDVGYYADLMNVSSRYLAQITRRMAGITPKQLIDQQLTEALRLALRQDDQTIQEVAYAYGRQLGSFHTEGNVKVIGTASR